MVGRNSHSRARQRSLCSTCNEEMSICSSCRDTTGTYNCATNVEKNKLAYPSTLLVMRHSERVDDLFPGWTLAAGRHGKYTPYDLNMPQHLPLDRPLSDYSQDTPITITGDILARMVGRGLLLRGYTPDVIYCSPSLRCLQTAQAVRAMCKKNNILLRVEPGLFENASLYPNGAPIPATPAQRTKFRVDESYKPYCEFQDIWTQPESSEEYNRRVRETLRRIASSGERGPAGGEELVVLVVAHASTVDLAVGNLRRRTRESRAEELAEIGRRVPYCALVTLEHVDGEWKPNPYAVPPVTYSRFSSKPEQQWLMRA